MPQIDPDIDVKRVFLRQDWRDAAFLHWTYPIADVRSLVPNEFELDLHAGQAWVGLTPFTTNFRPFGTVAVPAPVRYPETNVRTYVRAPDGTDGVWFFSLDVTHPLNVLFGRLAFPYHWSDMDVVHLPNGCRYQGRRRFERRGRVAGYDITVQPDPEPLKEQNDLDVFLTGRWHTYSKRGPLLSRFDITHSPWRLHRGECVVERETMLTAAGLPPADAPPVVHYSPGVDVEIGWPSLVRNPNRDRPLSGGSPPHL